MKIVFDTNIYVSLNLDPGGAADRAIEATLRSRWRIYSSRYLLAEFERVMLDDLKKPPRGVALALDWMKRHTDVVSLPSSRHIVPRDAKDTDVLLTALAAGADYLVTRDGDLLALNPYEKLQIVSLASYYRMLELSGLL